MGRRRLCEWEPVAELGVAFLCSDLGIAPEVRVDRTAYIASWFTVLNTTSASSSPPPSQRAADYLHSLQAVNADAATRRGFHLTRGFSGSDLSGV